MIDNDMIWQHFAVWQEFNKRVYHKTLTQDHIINNGNEKFIDTVTQIQVTEDGRYMEVEGKKVGTKCVFLEKDGKKYMAPAKYIEYLPFNPMKSYECYLKKSDTTIYNLIEQTMSVKITPEKTLQFRDLVQVFNPVQHTKPYTWTFLKLQAIASKYKGCKYRLCSVPACGKNANDIILHMIFNDNVRVSKPTLAKCESLFYFNQKVIPDEMTSLTPAQVREIEPFFLTIADESPVFQKHSMATTKNMNNVNISRASCIFTYNDIKSLTSDSKFFDEIWQNKAAFNSRYCALFLDGEITSSMPKLNNDQARLIMEQYYDKLRMIAKNIAYYVQNMHKELKHYDRSKIILKGRKLTNFEGVLDALDVYCQDQTEYDQWLGRVNDWIISYNEMVRNIGKEHDNQQRQKQKGLGFIIEPEETVN